MNDQKAPPSAGDLVRTQAETVPPPRGDAVTTPVGDVMDEHEIADELRRLAERAGGLPNLAGIVERMMRPNT